MKRLIPTLITAVTLFAAPVCASAADAPDTETIEYIRYAKQATPAERVLMLDQLVAELNAGYAGFSSESTESLRISHDYPRGHALVYTYTMKPHLAGEIDNKRLASPELKKEVQDITWQSLRQLCKPNGGTPSGVTALKALGLNEIRLVLTLNNRVLIESSFPFSQCGKR